MRKKKASKYQHISVSLVFMEGLSYHRYQYRYHVINRVIIIIIIIIASHGLGAGQLRETVWHSQGFVWEPFTSLGARPQLSLLVSHGNNCDRSGL